MISIVRELSQGFKSLFPAGRFRWVLVVLSMLAAAISVSELLVLKLFIGIVVREEEIARDQFILFGFGILLFFLITRASQYFQRTYRVKAFARSFKTLKKLRNSGPKNAEWAMAFELTSLLTNATQLFAVLIFMAVLDWPFALINLVILIAVLAAVASVFTRQLKIQEGLQIARDGRKARPAKRHGERIKAAETGGLISAAGMILILAALLFLSYNEEISVANTLIIFFGARLQNASITNGSRSLMRYARAKAGVLTSDDDDE